VLVSNIIMTLGYCYFVTSFSPNNSPYLHRVKIGFFSGNDLEHRIKSNYSKLLIPVCLYDYIPSHNARWAETTVHIALDRWRIHPKREMFDLSSDISLNAKDKIKEYIGESKNC
jgi:hypothetical protein